MFRIANAWSQRSITTRAAVNILVAVAGRRVQRPGDLGIARRYYSDGGFLLQLRNVVLLSLVLPDRQEESVQITNRWLSTLNF